jgi:hypothetical protein
LRFLRAQKRDRRPYDLRNANSTGCAVTANEAAGDEEMARLIEDEARQ